MNKTLRSILTLMLALVMVLAMAAPAMAFKYTAVSATTTTFDKYLVLDSTAKVPAVSFTFTVVPVSEDELPGNSAFKIYPGEGSATVTAAEFSDGQETFNTVQGYDTVGELNGKVYAKKTVTVTFANATFSEPGVYRYKVTENQGTDPSITYDTSELYLDVYVIDTNGTLSVEGYVLHTGNDGIAAGDDKGTSGTYSEGTRLAAKSGGFKNIYATYDLAVKKTVTGNQGSRDKYFKFTVDITNAAPGTYAVIYSPNGSNNITSNNATTYDNMSNPSTVVVAANGTGKLECYLQHDMTVTIVDLSSGAKYTITEAPEDYKISSIVATTGDDHDVDGVASAGAGTFVDTETGLTADAEVTFTNTRNGVIPTGVLLTIAPFAVLMIIGVLGAIVVLKKRKS